MASFAAARPPLAEPARVRLTALNNDAILWICELVNYSHGGMQVPVEAIDAARRREETAKEIVALEPVFNQLYSLVLLHKAERMPGVGEWVQRTREAMGLEQLQRNRLVMEGLFYAFTTEASLPSFGAYLDHLQALPAQSFQDRLLGMYLTMQRTGCSMEPPRAPDPVTRETILSSVDSYLAFIGERFGQQHYDAEIEAQAWSYARDPEAMKGLIISHLRSMWEAWIAPEWTRVRPMLTRSVAAFQGDALHGMTRDEAVRFVIGRDAGELHWGNQVTEADRVVFAPSAHVGPYLGKFVAGRTLVILFGARVPASASRDEPDLSRTEILTRLDALADDHRLRILRLAADAGGVKATDVMTALDVSQSAASRSLTQLTATGYLVEQRRDGGKWYTFDPARVQDTLGALGRFLRVAEKDGSP